MSLTSTSAEDANLTPTPRTHSTQSSLASLPAASSSTGMGIGANRVYIVTDTCFPTQDDFNYNKGTFNIDSVHSSSKNANARAKKILYNSGSTEVDVDRIIEEMRDGLFTGIGVGGEGIMSSDRMGKNGCYARRCEVESKNVDEDSEDEGTEDASEEADGTGEGKGEQAGDGDVEMG